MLSTIWAFALLGIIFKLFFLRESGHLSTLFYVGMGCSALLALPELAARLSPGAFALLIGCGLSYLIGVIVFSLEKPNLHPHFGYHELWHIFVLGGSTFHFMAVLLYVVPS